MAYQNQKPTPTMIMLEKALAERERRQSERHVREAAEHGDEIRARCLRFVEFVKSAWHVLEPAEILVVGWAIEAICDHLEAVTDGHINRLLINVPPGLGKSLLTNILWPAYEWGPRGMGYMKYVATSGDEGLTTRDGKKFRDLINSSWYQQLWPNVSLTSQSIEQMTNTATGARFGVPWSGMMGWRGHRLIGDDPHNLKNEKSDAMRDETVRLFREGASSRLNDVVRDAIVLIMQRVGPKDISGYIIENDPAYTYLMLPQEFEPDRKCITYRKDGTKLFEDPRKKAGELLFAERFPREAIEKRKSPKEGIGPYAYNAQDQQNPISREGNLFKREWFKMITRAQIPGKVLREVRGWDLAGTDLKSLQKTGARTAGVRIAMTDTKDIIITHCVAKGYGPAKVKTLVKQIAEFDGRGVEIDLPQDPAQSGKAQKHSFISDLAGYIVRITPEKGDKVERATPFSIQAEVGNVYIVEGDWNEDFFSEMETFPASGRKDIADACSRAFSRLTMTKPKRKETWAAGLVRVMALQEE